MAIMINLGELSDKVCVQCESEAYQNKSTGKVYKLCAKCGLIALSNVLGIDMISDLNDDENVSKVLDYTPYEEWAYGDKT